MSAKEKLSQFVQRTLHVTRNFLLTKRSKEFLVFLFFFLVASFFWLLQTLNENYETEISMPVKLTNVPADVLVTLPLPDNIQVVVKDRGAVLMNYILRHGFYPLNIDFNDFVETDGRTLVEMSAYQKTIASQLLSTSQIISVKPERLEIIYTHGEAKKMPVRINSPVSVNKQYYVSSITICPDSVIVYAPKEILDTMQAVYTAPLTLDNITDTVRISQNLFAMKGVKVEPEQVDLTFCTDMYIEKKLEIPIRAINFPADKVLKTFPSKVSVTFQVGLSRFRQITEDDFRITVSYSELAKSDSDKYRVKLEKVPLDIHHVRIEPAEVDYIIEQISFSES